MKYTSCSNPLRRAGAMAGNFTLVAFAMLVLLMVAGFAPVAEAIEPVKIGRDDTALDLTATTEIYNQWGEAFQVSTAAGADGIVRRIEVRSKLAAEHSGDWAVFALANVTDEQIDQADRGAAFPAGGDRAYSWPDLGSARGFSASRPSEGFRARPGGEQRGRRVPDHAQPGDRDHLRCGTGGPGPAADLPVGARGLQGHGQRLHAVPRHRAGDRRSCWRCS
jgi:hypothetical protein